MADLNFPSVQYAPANPPQFKEKRRPVPTSTSKPSGSKKESGLVFALKWACLVLTVAATIVFGIWAPLSYEATVHANNDGNKAQTSALSVASAANDLASKRIDLATRANLMASEANVMAAQANAMRFQASVSASQAMSIAVSQSSILDAVQTRIAAMGQLWLFDFCASRTTLMACSSYFETININQLAGSLAEPISTPIDGAAGLGVSATATPTVTLETTSAPGRIVTESEPSSTSTPAGGQTESEPSSTSTPAGGQTESETSPTSTSVGGQTESFSTTSGPSFTSTPTNSSTTSGPGQSATENEPSSTSTPTGGPKASGGAPRGQGIPVAAILAIVFGIIGFLGAAAGALVWRYRQRHLD